VIDVTTIAFLKSTTIQEMSSPKENAVCTLIIIITRNNIKCEKYGLKAIDQYAMII